MTLKISTFKLLKEDMRRRIWMIVLSAIMEFIFGPLAMMFYTSIHRMTNLSGNPEEELLLRYQGLHDELVFYRAAMVVIAAVGALIVAVWGNKHLFQRKMADLYNSMPVTRGRMFDVMYLNGILIWIVPFVAGWIIECGVSAFLMIGSPYIGDAMSHLGFTFLIAAFSFFMVYHLCLLCVSSSGTVMNSFVNILFLGTIAASIYEVVYMMISEMFTTYLRASFMLRCVGWLSPLASPAILLVLSKTNWREAAFSETMLFLIGSFVLMMLNVFLARRVYRLRKSEEAEGGVANPFLKAIMRITGGIVCGLIVGMIFYVVADWTAIKSNAMVAWSLVGVALGSFLVGGLLEIIFSHRGRAFFAHRWELAGTVIVSCLIFAAIGFDWVGYDTYLPETDNIAAADITLDYYVSSSRIAEYEVNGEKYYTYEYYLRQEELDYNAAHITDPDLIRRIILAGQNYDNTGSGVDVQIRVYRKHGGSYERHYTVPIMAEELLANIVETEEYMQAKYPVECGVYEGVEMAMAYIPYYNSNSAVSISGDELDALMDAYYADFRDRYSIEYLSDRVDVVQLVLNFRTEQEFTVTGEVWVDAGFTRTLALLQEYSGRDWTSFDGYTKDDFQWEELYLYLSDSSVEDYLNAYYLSAEPTCEEILNTDYSSNAYWIIKPDDADLDELWDDIILGTISGTQNVGGSSYVCIGYVSDENGEAIDCIVPKNCLPEGFVDRLHREKVYYGGF